MNPNLWRSSYTTCTEMGANLRRYRQAAGLTQWQLCEAINMVPDPAMISRIESGFGVPSPIVGERLTAWIMEQAVDRLQTRQSVATDPSAMTTHIVSPTPARATHPDTSRKAMDSINRENAWAIHNWIIEELSHVDFGLTHEQLWRRYLAAGSEALPSSVRTSQSGLRTRVSELVRGGVVRDSGRTRTMTTGRQAIVWELTDTNRAVSGGA